MLVDSHNRIIDYLRIAVTDRCNLRCVYCMPPEGIDPLPHGEILTYEEILRVARIALDLGIAKIRLTGGEPLARKGIQFLIRELVKLPGLRDLSMTTNGVLLGQHAEALRTAGLRRVNVSLDSLDPHRYNSLTRGGDLQQVWRGLMASLDAGIHPIKLNVVAMEGENGDEILSFARLTLEWPFEVRFIERMPSGGLSDLDTAKFVPGHRVLAVIRQEFPSLQEHTAAGNGPAQVYRIPGGLGVIGVIAPMTRHFCDRCNRLRLTSDGKLRVCLFSDDEIDLKAPLRGGARDQVIRSLLREATSRKPEGHRLHALDSRVKKCMRPMSRIGG